MTHASTTASPIEIDPGLIRLSVGLEHIDDLTADLAQAFAR
jgi:cystathionine gamma-synthase